MKCVNIRIRCKVKEILAFNTLEFFSPWTCFGNIWKIKNLFLLLILENMFLLSLWNLKEDNLLKNRQGFSQSIGEIFLTFFLVICMLNERCEQDSSLASEQKPCHGAIKNWSANLRIVHKRYFQFHWNCKQLE